jgi:ribosomal protein L4
MKASLYNIKGKKKSDLILPKVFDTKIREDIVLKFLEASKFMQPYSPAHDAGKKHSAAGTISHKRHDWKGHYGRGISRIPRKTMWRRGTQFFWIGAEISSARGGRRAHGPKGIGKERKINLKEINSGKN